MDTNLRSLVPALGVLLAFLIISCNKSGQALSIEVPQLREMKIMVSIGAENSFDANQPPSNKRDDNNVELHLVRFLIDNFELETISDDSIDFELTNIIVDLPLEGDTVDIHTAQIPIGSYDKLDIEIDSDAIEDSVLADTTGYYSLVVYGTFNDQPFTFRSKMEFEEEFYFSPPIEISDSTTSLSLNLSIDIDRWFKYTDPTNPKNQQRIERNIKKSFNAYCKYDNDKWWQQNEDD